MLRRRLAAVLLTVGCGIEPATGPAAEAEASTSTTDEPAGREETGPRSEGSTGAPGTTDGEPMPPEPPPPDAPGEPSPDTTFVDVSEAAGIVAPHLPGGNITGQAWGDLDRDGWLDLFVSGGTGANRLFHNLGDGRFEELPLLPNAAMVGIAKAGVTWADYDDDGWLDLYVAVLGSNVMLRNEGGRALVVTKVGAEHPGHGRSSAWADYDGDGRLDLYVVNGGDDHDALYHGEPDGRFTDRSALMPLPWGRPGYAATWTDHDGDGDLDLYVVNDHHTGNVLWRNDGPGLEGGWRFTDLSVAAGAALEVDAMGIAVGDYDGDLDLDVFCSDIHHTRLLRNELQDGLAVFSEVASETGLDHPSINWGASWVDVDLDGWIDLYLATQDASPPALNNRLFRNLGDGTFADVSEGCGCADPGFSTGVAAADYDADGAIDLLVGDFGEVVLLDWGLCKIIREGTRSTRSTSGAWNTA